ncbi:MAG TPA: hypothetical protein ACFYEK_01330 [Candidatus Wunengus sp. YC60]|uniref:hypothetical protein n=1 Tax=Candidatus Wunengus sp. YC60 TaxID=3367697 RepID=UPI004025BA21
MSQTKLLRKKVDILNPLNAAIRALVKMGEPAAKLEYFFTEKDSADLKRLIREFESDHFIPLKELAATVKATGEMDKNEKVSIYKSKNKNKKHGKQTESEL